MSTELTAEQKSLIAISSYKSSWAAYSDNMVKKGTWGRAPEIEAIAKLANTRILVLTGQSAISFGDDGAPSIIYLVHSVKHSDEKAHGGTHYMFGLPTKLVEQHKKAPPLNVSSSHFTRFGMGVNAPNKTETGESAGPFMFSPK